MTKAWRWLRRALRLGLVLAFLGAAAGGWSYIHFVVQNPGEHMERPAILQVISQESPVFYRDGRTPLGVFFAEEHRKYVRYDGLPRHFIDALVAAEDQDFWEHPGFSSRGIARAFFANLKAGRVVEGGSTLTQQTAKNLFKRRGRTYREKLRELANALRLERLYSKEDILEFYSNQFYVNGNGRGLAIAARFFFDKELSELGLQECAFLAGVVKSPNRYNPWVAGEERQRRARSAAQERVSYVLGRMLEEGFIDQERYDEVIDQALRFSRGHFRFARSVALDEVERELAKPEFQLILARHGVGDLGTSGLRITTTLDPVIQRGAHYGLKHHLTFAGGMLEQVKLEDFFTAAPSLKPVDPDQIEPGHFHRGLLLSVDSASGSARVDLGGVEGLLDGAAFERLATTLKRARNGNSWARPGRKERQELLASMAKRTGEGLNVSIRELDTEGRPVLDLEWRPKLQGAVLVLEEGAVRAMVGGSSDTDFNRAMSARRQFGSVWKPVLFEAALQLRWRPTDLLDNRRAVFPYQGAFYFPRPDHKDAAEEVSMAWATAKSENLATIWLLHHLLDRTSPEEFNELAGKVDLLPREGESGRDFRGRIHKAGLVPTIPKLNEGLWVAAREDIELDLEFDRREGELSGLGRMHYGLGFASHIEKLAQKDISGAERQLRAGLLRRSFVRQETLALRLAELRGQLQAKLAAGDPLTPSDLQGLSLRSGEGSPQLSFGDRMADGYVALTVEVLDSLLPQPRVPSVDGVGGDDDDSAEATDAEALDADGEGPGRTNAAVSERAEPSDEGAAVADDAPLRARPPADLRVGREAPRADGRRGEARRSRERPTSRSRALPGLGESAKPLSLEEERAKALATLLSDAAVVLEDQLRPVTLRRVRENMAQRRAVLGPEPDLYAPEQLALMQDYRVLVGLRYVAALAERSGVRSQLNLVQSLPLGSSDITLIEAAALYQTMLTGETYQFYPGAEGALAAGQTFEVQDEILAAVERSRRTGVASSFQLIQRIERADGELIYNAEREAFAVQSPDTSAELGSMLRLVVEEGTGRRAKRAVVPSSSEPRRSERIAAVSAFVPLAGKTGTTNSYRNAAFVGMVPGLADDVEDLAWGKGMVVATYVGYDDNAPMKRRAIRIAGASGGLPVWIETARSVVKAGAIGERVDLVDLALGGEQDLPLTFPDHFVPRVLDPSRGGQVMEVLEGSFAESEDFPPVADEPGQDEAAQPPERGGEDAGEPGSAAVSEEDTDRGVLEGDFELPQGPRLYLAPEARYEPFRPLPPRAAILR